MSVVQNTLIGRARNKVGGTVFSSWKGLNVLKSKPLTVANPRTDGQQSQRKGLALLVNLFRMYLVLLRYSFNEVSQGSTEWASFMKYNLKNALNRVGGDCTLYQAAMTFARGTLVNPTSLDAGTKTTSGFPVTWVDNSGTPGASSSDVCIYAVIDAANNVRMGSTSATRADEAATVAFASAMPDTTYTMYVWFIQITTRKTSDSVIIS